jgi:hypothetical protein
MWHLRRRGEICSVLAVKPEEGKRPFGSPK